MSDDAVGNGSASIYALIFSAKCSILKGEDDFFVAAICLVLASGYVASRLLQVSRGIHFNHTKCEYLFPVSHDIVFKAPDQRSTYVAQFLVC